MSESDPFTGPAGEYFAAARLTQRGWNVFPATGGMRRTDLVAEHEESGRLIHVQVKAGRGDGLFVGGGKRPAVEEPQRRGRSEWFILVELKPRDNPELPVFCIVPRNVVVAFVYLGHRHGTARENREVSAGPRTLKVRDFLPYREQWESLLDDPDEVPYRFEGGFWQWLDAVREVPEGHPGIDHIERSRP